MLAGKHILLGVTGGIAAYKTPWLVRLFTRAGADVRVVMTPAAREFVTPLTLATVSRHRVVVEMFPDTEEQKAESWTEHIDLAQWADVLLIAPASANTIAKIAHGLADNFLTTLVLALRCPLIIAPAMDVDMYRHESTQRNIDTLKQWGCQVVDPDVGELASGLKGPGRLPDLETLVDRVDAVLRHAHHDLVGKRVLVSAGPTQEPIDAVRYIGNRSSGKMGFAVAAAAAQRGADVTLVSGPVTLATPRHTRRIDVHTAREMEKAMREEFTTADIVVMAAAVADFAPAAPVVGKIKRDSVKGEEFSVKLHKNPDILKTLGTEKKGQVLVGFALETSDGVENARKKLTVKHLDAIILNDPGEEGAGFDADTNVVTVITADGKVEKLPKSSKLDVAHTIFDRIAPLLR
jgi:phosphopantothenoylcysteine decarboxylase / phosphopantothenate---cysteine ligase